MTQSLGSSPIMLRCTTDSKTYKQTIRIFTVISVVACTFVVYVNMNNNAGTFDDFRPSFTKLSNKKSKTKNSSNYSTDDILSSNFDENKGYNLKVVKNSRLENDSIELFPDLQSNVNKSFKDLENESRLESEYDWATKTSKDTHSLLSSYKISSKDSTFRYSQLQENRYGNKTKELVKQKELLRMKNRMKLKQRSSYGEPDHQLSLLFPPFKTFDKKAYDIMNMEPIQFDPAYKNPCFKGKDNSVRIKDGKLHCLPYFYIIGVKKSGTTDFYFRLKQHPEICSPSFPKESQWFSRLRFGIKAFSMNGRQMQNIVKKGIDPRKVEFFATLFDSAASCIQRSPSRDLNGSLYFKKITVEASPSTFHMQTKWEMFPGNENLFEPRYTNFNYIKHLTPNAKIIILFRNPTSRLYSDFLFSTKGKYGPSSPKVFHRTVVELVKAYNKCFHHSCHRCCVYNNTLKETLYNKQIDLAASFNAGFYAVFMRDLLDVFGTSQVLPILMTEYVTQMKQTLEGAFNFLEMSPVSSSAMQRILDREKKNETGKKAKIGPMLESTKTILDKFYRPFNEDMAGIMKDKRYLFLD